MAVTANQLAVALFDAAVGGYEAEVNAHIYADGEVGAATWMLNFSSVNAGDNGVFAYLLVDKMTGASLTDAQKESAADIVAGWLAAGKSRGQAVLDAINYLMSDGAAADATFGDAAMRFQNKVEAADLYTGASTDISELVSVIAGVTEDPATIPTGALGDTFTLTTGADAVAGTTGDDTINALSIKADGAGATTFSAFDAIDGDAGSDTLNIYTTNAFNTVFPTNTTVKNVEVVNINNAEGAAALGDASKFEGVEQLWQIGAATGVTKLAATTTAGFRNVDSNISVAAADAAATAKIALDNLGEGRAIAVTSGAVGTLNSVTVTGTVKDTNNDKTTAATALNVTVGKDVESLSVNTAVKTTLTVNNGAGTKTVSSVDASASAGAITYSAANTVANVKTGTGADTVTLNTLATATSKAASVTTGEGDDAVNVFVNANGQTGVKVTVDAGAGDDEITINNTGTVGVDVKAGAGNDSVTLSDGLGILASTDKVDGGDGTDTIVVAGKTLGAEDYITLNEVATSFEAIEFTSKASLDASRIAGYKTIETAASTSAADAQAAFSAYLSADAAADNAEAADAAAATAQATADLTDAVALRATADAAAVTAAATDAVALRAAATTAQATADLTDAVALRAAADTLQATANLTDAVALHATAVTLQATADLTDAVVLRATADALQATADLTDAVALRATADALQATADLTDAVALRAVATMDAAIAGLTDAVALRATADAAATAQTDFAALASAYTTALTAWNGTNNITNATNLVSAYEALLAGFTIGGVASAVAANGDLLVYATNIAGDDGDTTPSANTETAALTVVAVNADTAADAAEAADAAALASDAAAGLAEAADAAALAADAAAGLAEAADAAALAADAAAGLAEAADAAAAVALAAAIAADAADVAAANADALADAAEALDLAAVTADTAADAAEAADAAAVTTDAAADLAEAADAAAAVAQATAALTDAVALRAAANAALATYNTLNDAVVAETSVVTKVAADQALIANGSLNATAAGYVLDSDTVTAGNQTTYAGSLNITAEGDGNVITAQADSVSLKVAGLVSGDVGVTLAGDVKSATVSLTNGINNAKAELATEDTIASVNVVASGDVLKAMTSLTLTGNGEAVVTNANGSALVTVDASALGGTYALGADKGDATFGLDYWSNNAKAETIKLGSGIDWVALANSTVKNMDTVTGLNLVDDAAVAGKQIDYDLSDVLLVNAASFEKVTAEASSLNLALIDLAASNTKNEVVFTFGGDTYIYADNGTDANFVDDADVLVKVTGTVDLDLLVSSLNSFA